MQRFKLKPSDTGGEWGIIPLRPGTGVNVYLPQSESLRSAAPTNVNMDNVDLDYCFSECTTVEPLLEFECPEPEE